MSEKPGVVIYFDVLPALEKMTPSDAGVLFVAALRYAQNGDVPNLEGSADLVWSFIKSAVDRDSKRYEQKRLQAQWKVYCREEKKVGNEPLQFESWLVANGLSSDINSYPELSTDNNDGICYPSHTHTHTQLISSPSPTTTASSHPDSCKSAWEKAALRFDPISQLSEENSFERKRSEAIRKLEATR